ncbi:DUF6069 family protein [Micromonospora sp. DPT]|uniref:DUF6069 family protein n=1 Tax=Micromonospora sp. DPT TaxID=3142975 RepID=UPI00320A9C56
MNSTNDTGVVAGPASGQTSHTHRLRGLAGTGFIATLAAMVATTLAAALAQAVGVDFEVPDGGETIPLSGFAVVTGFFSVVGIVIAVALLRWSARPAERFVWTAVSLTAISLVPPLLSGANTATTTAPPRATPRPCDRNDPHPGAEPPHPDRLTIPQRDNARHKGVRERTNVAPGAATLHSRFLFLVNGSRPWCRGSQIDR